jgi:hypothetical protein
LPFPSLVCLVLGLTLTSISRARAEQFDAVLITMADDLYQSSSHEAAFRQLARAPAGPSSRRHRRRGTRRQPAADIFDSRGIASMAFNVQQLAAQFPGRGDPPYNHVFGADTESRSSFRAGRT